jgi:hypothetical protein
MRIEALSGNFYFNPKVNCKESKMGQISAKENEIEGMEVYMEAFYESWKQRSTGEPNHSGISTIEGPKKTAESLLDAFVEGI